VKIILRPYRAEDFEALYRIDHACYSPDVAYSRGDMRAYLGFGGSECVVAEIENEDASGARLPEESEPPANSQIGGFCISAHRGKDGYIVTMDVLEEYRRRGIATALLDEIEKRLAEQGVRRVALETATDNHVGVAFWQRHGYRTRGIRKGYYPGGRDAYAMTKTLAPAK
jgi:[ribosomal protein S18]-alanine N-acetyltransferase